METIPLWLTELEKELATRKKQVCPYNKQDWLAEDSERTKEDWDNFLCYSQLQQKLAEQIEKISQQNIVYAQSSPKKFEEYGGLPSPQQLWLNAEKTKVPEKTVFLLDFTAERPAIIPTGPVEFFVWGAFVTRQTNNLFVYPIGGPTVWEGYLHLFPLIATASLQKISPGEIYSVRNRSQGDVHLNDNPGPTDLALWGGVAVSKLVLNFMHHNKINL